MKHGLHLGRDLSKRDKNIINKTSSMYLHSGIAVNQKYWFKKVVYCGNSEEIGGETEISNCCG